MGIFTPTVNRFTAIPFTATGNVPASTGSGIDPLLGRVLDIANGAVDRFQDREDLRTATKLLSAQNANSNAILALLQQQNASAGTVTPVQAGGGVAAVGGVNPMLLIVLGGAVLAFVALRK